MVEVMPRSESVLVSSEGTIALRSKVRITVVVPDADTPGEWKPWPRYDGKSGVKPRD